MKEKMQIDLKGSIHEFVGETVKNITGFAILMVIVGCLVAPVFATLFEESLHTKYDTSHHYERYALVAQKMLLIKVGLWIVAIVAWIFVIACGIIHG